MSSTPASLHACGSADARLPRCSKAISRDGRQRCAWRRPAVGHGVALPIIPKPCAQGAAHSKSASKSESRTGANVYIQPAVERWRRRAVGRRQAGSTDVGSGDEAVYVDAISHYCVEDSRIAVPKEVPTARRSARFPRRSRLACAENALRKCLISRSSGQGTR